MIKRVGQAQRRFAEAVQALASVQGFQGDQQMILLTWAKSFRSRGWARVRCYGVPGRAMRAISGGQPGGAGVLHGRRCLYFLLGTRSGLLSKLLPMRVEVPRG